MIIGIVADIHDAVAPLKRALSDFETYGVERVVSLGDAFDSHRIGEPSTEVARLLNEAEAVGVWGNHDVGLSHGVTDQIREEADPGLLKFASRLQAELVLDEYHFSHLEPWKDARLLEDLWRFDGVPDTVDKAKRCFGAVSERVLFMGHFHTWLAMREDRGVEWRGFDPILLSAPHRYLVVVGAVVEGWCATFDSSTAELIPIRCAA